MKKILITLMTVLALTAFTACESKDVETAEETTIASSVAEETTVETKAVTENESEEVVGTTEIFKGTGYTLEIDGEKWLDGTEYLDHIAKVAENSDVGQSFDFKAEDLKNMGDAIYYHSTNGSNFNVTVAELGTEIDDAMLIEIATLVQEQYNSMAGYTCGNYELVDINGYRALKFVITTDDAFNDTALKLNLYCFYPGTKQVGVTFTTAASDFDKTVADFEEVLNTISFE